MIRTVYVIGVDDNPVKVGVADDVAKRLSSLQVGCPDELVIHHAEAVPHYAAQKIEAAMHRELRPHHRRGEWFDVTASFAIATLTRIAPEIVTAERQARAARKHLHGNAPLLDAQHPWAVEAVAFYKSRRGASDGLGDLQAMNRAIVESDAGVKGLEVFKVQLVDGKELSALFYRNMGGHARADQALRRAVNALSIWYAARREKLLVDEILGNVA